VGALIFLASEDSDFITGQTIIVESLGRWGSRQFLLGSQTKEK
jgi:hypothetical protein